MKLYYYYSVSKIMATVDGRSRYLLATVHVSSQGVSAYYLYHASLLVCPFKCYSIVPDDYCTCIYRLLAYAQRWSSPGLHRSKY